MKAIKKLLCLFLIVLLLVSTINPVLANEDIKVKIDDLQIVFDVSPKMINDRTMVPLRKIFEALGATVDWDAATQTITSSRGKTTVILTINHPIMYVNGNGVILDAPACLVESRTLVPIRAISEAFNLKVDWDDATQTVLITRPNVNMTAYNKLKNIILAKGEKSTINEYYYIYYGPSDEKYNLMLCYAPTDDFIIWYYVWEGNFKDAVMISIYTDTNPALCHTAKYPSGDEYKLLAYFPKSNQPFVEMSSTFPEYLEPYEYLNLDMALMDVIMQGLVDMSFADFGLYYENS